MLAFNKKQTKTRPTRSILSLIHIWEISHTKNEEINDKETNVLKKDFFNFLKIIFFIKIIKLFNYNKNGPLF